jgi:hypothetical protein
MDEDINSGVPPHFTASAFDIHSDSTNTLSSKLMKHCPSLFSSLFKGGKEAINNLN